MQPDKNSAKVRLKIVRTAALLVWVVMSLAPLVARAQQSAAPKRVLILYWYGKDFPANVRFDQSFQAALQSAPYGAVEYYPEYLESDRFPGESQAQGLCDYLRQKYADRTVDVVVAAGGPALEFLLKNRHSLFTKTPIVFIMSSYPEKEELAAGPGLTGIVTNNTYRKTLDLALRLHPDTEQVFIISGTLERDKRIETMAREELQGYKSRARVSYLTDKAPGELIARMKGLPERSIALYVWQQSTNEQGKVLESGDVLALIAKSAPVPIYGMSGNNVGRGIVGGYVFTTEGNANRAAEIALRIANGARAQDIPVENAPALPMFDWRELRRWGVSEDQLPPGRVIQFREPFFWDHYKWRIIGVISLCAVEGLLIFALLAQRARRRRVEEALRDNDERLKLALSAANMGAWDWRLDTGELKWSDGMRQIFGFAGAKSAVTTELFIDLIHPDDRPAVSQAITWTVDRGAPYDIEFRTIHQDGSIHWVMGKGKALLDEAGQAARMLGVNMDITDRRRAEQRLRSYFELPLIGMAIMSPDRRFVEVNQKLCDILGYSNDQLTGMSWVDVTHPDDVAENILLLDETLRGKTEGYVMDKRFIHRDGHIVYASISARCARRADRTVDYLALIVQDITQRKQAEDRLMESEAQLRLLTELIPQHIWTSFPGSAADYRNRRWLDYTGMTIEEVRQKGWMTALHPDDHERVFDAIREASSQKGIYEVEIRLKGVDGQYRWFLSRAIPQLDQEGNINKWYGTNTDIEDRKRAQLNTQFINQLDFELSQIADADEIIRLATSRLGEYLGVASCYVIEVNPAAGSAFVRESWDGWRTAGPSIVGEYRISDFVTPECLGEFEAGRATVVKDVMNDPRMRDFTSKYKSLGIGAFISIPALNERQWEANLTVDHPQARDWRPDETQLMRDITARLWQAYKRARAVEALRDSEERLRLALEAGRMGVWEWDPRTNAVKWSKEHYTVIGLMPFSFEPDYHTWADRVYPDDLPAATEAMSSAIEKKREYRCEYRIIWPDGSVRWVEGRGKPVYDEDGQCLKVSGLIVDITETKRAELNTQFINQLDFELSQISDADEIIRLATGGLGEYLGVASCKVVEVNPAADLAVVRESWHGRRLDGKSIVGDYRISDFTTPEFREALEAGQTAVVNDVRTDPRTRDFASKYESFDVGAFVTIPALKEKHWEASLNINHPHSRDWRPDETQLMRDITARLWPAYKRARAVEALRDSEERLRLALEAGRMGVWEWDPKTNAVKWSKEHYTIMGLQPFGVEPDYYMWEDRVHPEDLTVAMERMSRAIEEKGEYRHEYRIILPDGKVRWVEDRAKPVYDGGGQCLKVSGLIVDITERKEAEEALRESEERYRSVVESQTELICRYLPDTTLTFVNDAYCRYFDKTQEELISTKFLDLIPEPAREAARKHIESLVENPRIEIDEHEVLLPDGGIGWQQWVDHAILDSNGKVMEFQAVGRDITERKQAEEERREGEERLRLALEAGRMGVWEWDLETDDLKWSREHYTIMGLEPFSFEPKNYRMWADRVYPDDIPVVTGVIRKAIEEKGEYRCEYRIIWPDGGMRWVEGRGKPIHDEGGRCLKVSGLIVDISERKEAEEALRESEEALRKSYARIEDLAGRLIAAQEEERRHIARELHDDLNQQVAALAIGISRLKRQFPDAGDAVQGQIVKLQNKTDMLSERIRQVSHELHSSILQHVGLPAALNSYCAEFSDREGIAVALDIGDGIEGVSPEAALCLYRVAQESLRNVARHSGARRAVVTLARANGAVELRVVDQGVGFDPGQAHECRGLGLVSMEERVKLLHGSFVLTTRPGAGTELRAQIPLRGEHEQTTGIVG